ncbi:MAG: glutamate--tRNA ligase [Pseudomonadota bacterium]
MSPAPSPITRFAPSPTGHLHIGGARTALFNWLFARRNGGRFLLRIEDTDQERSTEESRTHIIQGLRWLGLDWDGKAVRQSENLARHQAVCAKLLHEGLAYRCYASPQELAEMRKQARAQGRPMRYDGRWRDRSPKDEPKGIKPVIRLKAPQTGETTVQDLVFGPVTTPNSQLDDMVLLRADGTPTYMLSAVVDDIDMGITHIIRGDDHMANSARHIQLFAALGARVPAFAHLPLIHGESGGRMSKRDGHTSLLAYRDEGYLPESLRNYLLRLGWSHGDDEIISPDQAIAWFDLSHVGRSPARFNLDKLKALNRHYLKNRPAKDGIDDLLTLAPNLTPYRAALSALWDGVVARADTLKDISHSGQFLLAPPSSTHGHDIFRATGYTVLAQLLTGLHAISSWSREDVQACIHAIATQQKLKLSALARPLRFALMGEVSAPELYIAAEVLGKQETCTRLEKSLRDCFPADYST